MVTIEGVTHEVLLTVHDDGGSYEWQAASLLRDPQGRLYLIKESGCSCNSHLDYPSRSDLTPVATWQQAAARFGESHYESGVKRSAFRAAARAAVEAGNL